LHDLLQPVRSLADGWHLGLEAHDNRLVTELPSDLKSGATLLADRGCDADWIRAFAGEHGA
jgi:hypothetical protein